MPMRPYFSPALMLRRETESNQSQFAKIGVIVKEILASASFSGDVACKWHKPNTPPGLTQTDICARLCLENRKFLVQTRLSAISLGHRRDGVKFPRNRAGASVMRDQHSC